MREMFVSSAFAFELNGDRKSMERSKRVSINFFNLCIFVNFLYTFIKFLLLLIYNFIKFSGNAIENIIQLEYSNQTKQKQKSTRYRKIRIHMYTYFFTLLKNLLCIHSSNYILRASMFPVICAFRFKYGNQSNQRDCTERAIFYL